MSLKVESLVSLNPSVLILVCGKENYKLLLEHWHQMLGTYLVLCDFRSDVWNTAGKPKLQESLEIMDKQMSLADGQPVPNMNAYLILFAQRFFERQKETQSAITLHEVGHFYVYQTGILRNLRQGWSDGERMFNDFVKLVRQDPKWFSGVEDWLKRFYQYYVFSILKIPGEIFTNLWVKENFVGAISLVVKEQIEENRHLVEYVSTITKTRLARFPLFLVVLRLEGLLMVLDSSEEETRNDIQESVRLCWKKMSELLLPDEMPAFESVRKEIMSVCSSADAADQGLFSIFKRYVDSNALVPADFVDKAPDGKKT